MRDDHGRLTLWQWPNIPLYGWAVFKILSMFVDASPLKDGLNGISTAFLFTWAYLEITQGVNYFRRVLGLVVMGFVVVGLFRY